MIWTNAVLTLQCIYSPRRNCISKSTKKIETLESYLCLPKKCLLIIMNYLLIKKPILCKGMLKRRRKKKKKKKKKPV